MIAIDAQPLTGLLGVVHRSGRTWRVIVADLAGDRPRIAASETIPADQPDRVRSVLEHGKVTHVIQVVPASSSVVRTCRLPDADDATLAGALRLQAETWFLAGVSDHRTAGGVLEAAPGESSRTGLVVSWPESAAVTTAPSPVPVTWVPEPAAIAALLGPERPAEPLVSVDRRDGSLTIGLCDTSGASIRATHDDLDDAEWTQTLSRLVIETCLSSDQSPAFARRLADDVTQGLADVAGGDAGCLLPPAVRSAASLRLEHAGADEAWWSSYGVAAGAVLAAAGPLAATTRLLESPIIDRPSMLDRLGRASARPRTAVAVAVACVVVIAVLPLIANGLRLAVLRARHGDLEAVRDQVREAQARLTLYDALDGQAWPMSRVLADIASNTPEGITMTSLVVSLDQGGFIARGEALGRNGMDAAERVVMMQEQLADAGLRSTAPDWGQLNNFGTYDFTLSGTISEPYRRRTFDVKRDYGRWAVWERQNGLPARTEDGEADPVLAGGDEPASTAVAVASRGASGATSRPIAPRASGGSDPARSGGSGGGGSPALTDIPSAGDPDGGPIRSTPDRGPRLGPGTSGDGAAADSTDVRIGGAAGGGDIPEPLSEAQIKAMDLATAKDYFRRVASARQRFDRDETQAEVSARLKEEFNMLKDRVMELSRARRGGGP